MEALTGARYLVRFDDLAPTMNWAVWEEVEKILIRLTIRPILGIVPDNRDEFLVVSPPRRDFWSRVRSWQERGWTIGVHGYQHRTITGERGLVGINARSEFAGLPRAEQESKLGTALAIFHQEDVDPTIWLAPNHSFDANTVSVVQSLGISAISDGLFLWPFIDRAGMKWIPHQFWRFHNMPFGVWTVGCHHNRWTEQQLAGFERDLLLYRERIVDVPSVLRESLRRDRLVDHLISSALLTMIRAKRQFRRAGVMKPSNDAY